MSHQKSAISSTITFEKECLQSKAVHKWYAVRNSLADNVTSGKFHLKQGTLLWTHNNYQMRFKSHRLSPETVTLNLDEIFFHPYLAFNMRTFVQNRYINLYGKSVHLQKHTTKVTASNWPKHEKCTTRKICWMDRFKQLVVDKLFSHGELIFGR